MRDVGSLQQEPRLGTFAPRKNTMNRIKGMQYSRQYAIVHEVLRDTCTIGSLIDEKQVNAEIARRTFAEGFASAYTVKSSGAKHAHRDAGFYCGYTLALGGFAVSADGRYINGAEGFGGELSHAQVMANGYVPVARGTGTGTVVTVPVHVETLEEEEARVNAAIEALETRREAAARDALLARVSALSADQLAAILASAETTEDEQSESAVA